MKFQDKENPYFGGGKLSMHEYVNKEIKSMEKEMTKKSFEPQDCYGISEKKIFTLILAGGGPSMLVEIDTEKNNGHYEIIGGRYIYSWYTASEIIELDKNEAETVANYYRLYYEHD